MGAYVCRALWVMVASLGPVLLGASAHAAEVSLAPKNVHVDSDQRVEPYLRVVPYGFLLPSFGIAVGPVASFGQLNQQAITAAYPRDAALAPDALRTRFAVSQSRAGLELTLGDDGAALVELDAINFALAAPTVMTRPRLRRALVTYRASRSLSLTMGQDWDIFAPLNPFTHNFVGNLFVGGNAGFMRLQARARYAPGPLEVTVAIGAPGFNNQASEGALELTAIPLGEMQLALPLGSYGRVGVSGMAGAYAYARSATHVARRPVGGVNAFAQLRPHRQLEANIEAYWGQNIGDTGTLTLSQGGANHEDFDVQEAGGFASVRVAVLPAWKIYGSFGLAQVTRGMAFLTPFSEASSSAGVVSLLRNQVVGAGSSVSLARWLEAYGEYGYYRSRYKEDAGAPTSAAHRIELGLMANLMPGQ